MSPERWQKVAAIVGHAAELASPAEREVYLDQVCGHDAELRADVARLLEHARKADTFLEAPPAKRIGPYVLVEEIGRGGMGIVYRAERLDGRLSRPTAIKIVGRNAGSALASRLREEGRILGALQHPNIAALYDAGVSEDGVAYLVMELVAGRPLIDWCVEGHLSGVERLQLFTKVCAAVQYAQQHLVIHRDLKPGNILVAGEGEPKLLDFGIAKVLMAGPEADSGAAGSSPGTVTLLGAMTPDYASPEQIEGASLTTASDVYSLGVILYQMLSGRHPFPSAGQTLTGILGTRRNPVLPPTGLGADVDSIVARAVAFDPQERYGSARELAEDITNFLAGKPVLARPVSAWYQAWKFVRRHRMAVGAATAAVLFIAGFAVYAEVQRRRADQRFRELRALARSVVFEIHDRIAPLSGSTGARKVLVERAAQYLDSLASQTGDGDISLLLELASSYRRVASVTGDPGQANLGDPAGALRYADRAIEVARRAVRSAPSRNLEPGRELYRSLQVRYALLGVLGRPEEQRVAGREKGQLIRRIAAEPAATVQDQIQYAGELFDEASAIPMPADRIQPFAALVKRYEDLAAQLNNDPRQLRNVALMEKYLGSSYSMAGRYDESLTHKRRALDIDSALADRFPEQRHYRADVRNDLRNLSSTANDLHRYGEAESLLARSVALSRQLLKEDAHDRSAVLGLAFDLEMQCKTIAEAGRPQHARAYCNEAIQLLGPPPATDVNSGYVLGKTYAVLADLAIAQKRPVEACQWYRNALASMPKAGVGMDKPDLARDSGNWKKAAAAAGCVASVR